MKAFIASRTFGRLAAGLVAAYTLLLFTGLLLIDTATSVRFFMANSAGLFFSTLIYCAHVTLRLDQEDDDSRK